MKIPPSMVDVPRQTHNCPNVRTASPVASAADAVYSAITPRTGQPSRAEGQYEEREPRKSEQLRVVLERLITELHDVYPPAHADSHVRRSNHLRLRGLPIDCHGPTWVVRDLQEDDCRSVRTDRCREFTFLKIVSLCENRPGRSGRPISRRERRTCRRTSSEGNHRIKTLAGKGRFEERQAVRAHVCAVFDKWGPNRVDDLDIAVIGQEPQQVRTCAIDKPCAPRRSPGGRSDHKSDAKERVVSGVCVVDVSFRITHQRRCSVRETNLIDLIGRKVLDDMNIADVEARSPAGKSSPA